MRSRFVEVSRQAMMGALEAAGFQANVRGNELAYGRRHHLNRHLEVLVYTSLPSRGGDARPCGHDAIRVVLLAHGEYGTRPLYKATKVLRTGSEQAVIERTLERAREAYAAGTLRLRGCHLDEIDAKAKELAKAASRG
jgi:hypothetical protein